MRFTLGDSFRCRTSAATKAVAVLLCAAALGLCGACKDGSGNLAQAWSNLWKPKNATTDPPKPPESDQGLHRPFAVGPAGPAVTPPPPGPPAIPTPPATQPLTATPVPAVPEAPKPAAPIPRPGPTSRPRRPSRMRLPVRKVLFIGNTYTTEHDMPEMVQALARAAREKVRLHVAVVAPSGSTLSSHWYQTAARKAIRTGGWDWVVLQEQSTRPLTHRDLMRRFARELDKEARNFGAKTMFYLTWARKNKPRTQIEITAAYVDIARELKSPLAPVGIAWKLCREQRPALALHQRDMSHPTVAGAYLTACVFYASLFGRTPMGLPATLVHVTPAGKRKVLAEINPTSAALMQRIAWDAVRTAQRMMKSP